MQTRKKRNVDSRDILHRTKERKETGSTQENPRNIMRESANQQVRQIEQKLTITAFGEKYTELRKRPFSPHCWVCKIHVLKKRVYPCSLKNIVVGRYVK